MDAIRTWLCVGNRRDARNAEELAARGIGAVLQLAEPLEYSSITSLFLPVQDGIALSDLQLRDGVDFVLNARNLGHTSLIACSAGISRSVSFAVATLKEAEGMTLLDALRIVKTRHAESQPHPALWESLCEYYDEELSFGAMLDIVLAN